MILYEDATLEEPIARARLEILAALSSLHLLHCYSSVDALEAYLENGQNEMAAAGFDRGLTRVALVYTNPRAVEVVARRMKPGYELAAWPQPDAWVEIYKHIETLKEMASRTEPRLSWRKRVSYGIQRYLRFRS